MKKKITSAFIAAVVVIAGIIYGITIKNKDKINDIEINKNEAAAIVVNNAVANLKNKQDVKIINIHTDSLLIKPHKDIKSLKLDSEIIVKGVVLSAVSYISGPGVITKYKLKVSKSYNNNAKAGDIISIAAGGGIVDYKLYSKINAGENNKKAFDKSSEIDMPENTKVKVTIGENNLMEKSKEYIIFAKTDQVLLNGIILRMYCSINSYEGQFDLDAVNKRVINKALNYNKSINEFEQEIQQ
ncbi:MAG: hypothetical protein LIR50_02890 [Bacillota bacterium]|nr:hypothetical protein [Bacillota bacterium]